MQWQDLNWPFSLWYWIWSTFFLSFFLSLSLTTHIKLTFTFKEDVKTHGKLLLLFPFDCFPCCSLFSDGVRLMIWLEGSCIPKLRLWLKDWLFFSRTWKSVIKISWFLISWKSFLTEVYSKYNQLIVSSIVVA